MNNAASNGRESLLNLDNIEEAKRDLVLRAYEDGSYKKCIYAGIISRLDKAKDLTDWNYLDKDDLFLEIIQYLWREGAEKLLTSPATASMETRLRRLAERHTRNYITKLLRRRDSVMRNKDRIQCEHLSDEELAVMKAQERRAA